MLACINKKIEVTIPTLYCLTYSERVKIASGKIVEGTNAVRDSFKISAGQM